MKNRNDTYGFILTVNGINNEVRKLIENSRTTVFVSYLKTFGLLLDEFDAGFNTLN